MSNLYLFLEYSKQWLLKGRSWNEVYLFRAFLMDNNSCKILFFHDMVAKMYREDNSFIDLMGKVGEVVYGFKNYKPLIK
jgi:hypothetical protein